MVWGFGFVGFEVMLFRLQGIWIASDYAREGGWVWPPPN